MACFVTVCSMHRASEPLTGFHMQTHPWANEDKKNENKHLKIPEKRDKPFGLVLALWLSFFIRLFVWTCA